MHGTVLSFRALSKEQEEKRVADTATGTDAPDERPNPSARDGDASAAAAAPAPEPERPRTLEQALDLIDLLRGQLAAKTEEAMQNHDRLLRERAELENFKKRMHRERSEALRYATEPLLRDLLPVVDNLERAVEATRAAGDEAGASQIEALLRGVEMVLQQLTETLERHGVSRVAGVGEPFDPNHHEAVAHVESDEAAPGAVLEQYRAGYRLHDRLLRPAQVTVAKERRTS